MSWPAQNWIWVVAIGIAWFVLRSGRANGHAGAGLLESLGSEVLQAGHLRAAQPSKAPEAAIDAVSGQAVTAAQALSTVYQDKVRPS